jgi:DNA-directed RNA polymerase specialized sigma24 family protein
VTTELSGEQEDERVGAPVDERVSSDDVLDSDAPSAGTQVVQEAPAASLAQLRVDFGAHLEANYQRLVAQLYAITLDPGEAHDVVQDAYSRAWRSWATISRSPDPSAWIRRVAVRSTIRSFRRVLARIGIGRPRSVGEGVDPRTGALLAALGRLSAAQRRAVVLFHMAGASLEEIAAVEQASVGVVQARLARSRHVVTEGMADVLPAVLGGDHPAGDHDADDYDATDDADDYDADEPEGYQPDGYRSEGYADGYGTGGYGADGYAAGYGVGGHDNEGERR